MQEKKSTRLFVAIAVKLEVANQLLLAAQQQLGMATDDLYAADQLHLTLTFLGDIPYQLIPKLAAGLNTIISNINCFNLTIEKWSLLGSNAKPALVALVNPTQALMLLYQQISTYLLSLGIERDKQQFLPHVTCSRKKDLTINKTYLATALQFEVDAVALYSSDLSKLSQRYTMIKQIMLATN